MCEVVMCEVAMCEVVMCEVIIHYHHMYTQFFTGVVWFNIKESTGQPSVCPW